MTWSGRRSCRRHRGVHGAGAVASPAAASGGGGTPLPHVTGPLPVTATSYPFGAADHTLVPEDLRKVGYVEDEYLVSGKANVYTWPGPGPAEVRTPDAPYTTRILVRRPAKASRFSGNVVVEMLNPSNRFDLNIGWAMAHRQMVRNGDAWVGITDKPIDVVALKKFDPARYGSLSFANPLALDDPAQLPEPRLVRRLDDRVAGHRGRARMGHLQPGRRAACAAATAQTRSAYRGGRHDWRGGHGADVQHVYGFGYSQTGGYLYDYINAIHPLDVARNGGHPIYDGYIVAVAGAGFVGSCRSTSARPSRTPVSPGCSSPTSGVPIIHVMSQSDYLFGIAVRRDDSDAPADRYRHYEMAGAAHATPDELNFSAAPADIVKAGVAVPPMTCGPVPAQPLPEPHLLRRDAAEPRSMGALRDQPRPTPTGSRRRPPGPRRQACSTSSATSSTACARRTSTCRRARGSAARPAAGSASSPVTRSRSTRRPCKALYPTHGAYVRAVAKDTARLVAGRFITGYDGLDLIREAAQADVP